MSDYSFENKRQPRLYRGYGLCILSDFHLPGMPEMASGEPDVTITRDTRILQTTEPVGHIIQISESVRTINWPSIARYTIHNGGRIHVECAEGASDQVIALPLLGPVFALTLHLRGLIVLHGSALSIHGRAVAFLGDKGAGKSTLVAACLCAGHQLLADDIVAINSGAKTEFEVMPSSALFKLTPETDSAIDLGWALRTPSPHASFDKIIRDAGQRFSVEPKALDSIYVIRRGQSEKIEPMGSSAAVQALLRFSHVVRFGDYIVKVGGAAEHLRRSAPLAGKVSILNVSEGVGKMATTVSFIEQFLSSVAKADMPK